MCKPLNIITIFTFVLISAAVAAAPSRYGYDEEIREMREGLDTIRHEVSNHETELQMFTERVNNQESTISSMRQQMLDANQSNKDLVKGSTTSVESKITNLESSNKNLISDLQVIKSHANETSSAIGTFKQRLVELERTLSQQNQQIENLQAAMRSLMEALQEKDGGVDTAKESGSKLYKVKSGDSLDKIAKAHNTTIKAIKEINGLTTDKIVVGKNIKLP